MEGVREEAGGLIAGKEGREGMQNYITMSTSMFCIMVLVYKHTHMQGWTPKSKMASEATFD